MSIEKNLERIADALEILAGSAPPANFKENEPAASGGDKATPKTAAEKKAEAAKKRKAAKEKKDAAAKAEAEPDSPTREDVQTALMSFVKEGPGKDAAKEVFEEFKAGSISTLDEGVYGAFIDRLNEVSGG